MKKDLFIKILNSIKEQDAIDSRVGKSLEEIADGYILLNTKLSSLYFGKWDRYTSSSKGTYYYGWIERDDGKSDFAIIAVEENHYWYMTSSAKKDAEIREILEMPKEAFNPCKRIEDLPWANEVNCIKLGDKK
jgi:hypothetical protein